MQKIMTCLGFPDRAEEAVDFYVSVIRNSRIINKVPFGDSGPGPKGQMMTALFELDGQRFLALNGGSPFSFAIGMSLIINCDTQEEIDEYWAKLSEGGQPGPCGWLTDKFGVSWQIVPTIIGDLMTDSDPAKRDRVMKAVLQMSKLNIAEMKRAYEGAASHEPLGAKTP